MKPLIARAIAARHPPTAMSTSMRAIGEYVSTAAAAPQNGDQNAALE